MITKSFLWAIALFACYNVTLLFKPLRERFSPQSQWQSNLIKAQNYTLNCSPRAAVLVGSSLAERLEFDAKSPPLLTSLAFSGDGPLTGLEIVRRDQNPPSLIIIEINMVLRDRNETLLANTFRPVFAQARRFLPALQEKNQPANFLAAKVGEKIIWLFLHCARRLSPRTPDTPPLTSDTGELFRLNLAGQHAELSIVPPEVELELRLLQLKTLVAELKQREIRCVLLEMPIDASLYDLPRPALIRNRIAAEFADVPFIQPDGDKHYRTTDGLHLPGDEAAVFKRHLNREFDRLGLSDPIDSPLIK